jgi:hypothetical protein
MTSERAGERRGALRVLVAVLLLAGVFTMHGLTGSHDAAMAMDAPRASGHQVHPAPAASHLTAAADHVGSGAGAGTSSVHSSPPSPVSPVPVVDEGHDGHLHDLGEVCLAMLAALLLALIVALTRRSLAAAHPVELAALAVLVPVDGPSPPWRRPTLSKLCVLRT